MMLAALSAASGTGVMELDWMARSRPHAFDALWGRHMSTAGEESSARRAGETWADVRRRLLAGRAALGGARDGR